jgi:hypothetical protein
VAILIFRTLDFRNLLHRQIGGFFALENAADVGAQRPNRPTPHAAPWRKVGAHSCSGATRDRDGAAELAQHRATGRVAPDALEALRVRVQQLIPAGIADGCPAGFSSIGCAARSRLHGRAALRLRMSVMAKRLRLRHNAIV